MDIHIFISLREQIGEEVEEKLESIYGELVKLNLRNVDLNAIDNVNLLKLLQLYQVIMR